MLHPPRMGNVLISLTNGAYNDGTRLANLRIEDESTNRFVVNVDMDGPTFAGFVTGTGVQVGEHHLTLAATMNAADHGTRLDVRGPHIQLRCALTGEQLAAILGNAVTRVSGARINEEI